MTGAAGTEETTSRPRRRGGAAITTVAVLLLLGGGTAVAAGVIGQDPDPTAPPAVAQDRAESTPDPSSTTGTIPVPEPSPSRSATADAPASPTVAVPVEVHIPAIGVQSELLTVGLNPDGTLEVPQPGPDYDKAAWYDGSPRPGETGAAVIEGHVDGAGTGPSIFYNLGSLAAGDEVQVVRADGSTATFVVDEVRAVPKDDFPTVEVYARTERPELRLITCGGELDSSGHYVDNTVVFAHQI